jgi:DNA mismatch endonuclease, patch repair protein
VLSAFRELRCKCARCHCAELRGQGQGCTSQWEGVWLWKKLAISCLHIRGWGRASPAILRDSSVDTFSKSKRSRIMRAVHSKGTTPEKKCECLLRSLKLSFRRHATGLPGQPDFVLEASRLALFVHGCFWHAHKGCKNAVLPTSNLEYWSRKIDRNRKRDRRVRDALRRAGWRTAVIWECKLKDAASIASRLGNLARSRPRRKKLR